MNEHTIVVRFPEGVQPSYSAATEFQGGQVVAVCFNGNRIEIAQELEEALSDVLEDMGVNSLDGLTMHATSVVRAIKALEEAKKVKR